MARLFFSILLCFSLFLHVCGQGPDVSRRHFSPRSPMNEQMQVERIAFFTEKMGLTPEEAQLFWPIYNEMENKKNTLFNQRASIMKQFAEKQDKATDKEAEELLAQLDRVQQQEAQLQSEYHSNLRKVLPASKIMKFHVAEMEFRNYLFQKMRNRQRKPLADE